MAKVLYHVTMSLDGFIAAPDHAMDWVFRSSGPKPEPNPEAMAVIESTGAALGGRNGYEVGRKQGQHPSARKLFGGAWSGPIFVLTHRPPADEADSDFSFLTGDIRVAVGTAVEAAAGKDLLVLGGTVCRHRSTDVAHQYTSTKQAGLASCAITNATSVACPAGSRSWARARAAVTNSRSASRRLRAHTPWPGPDGCGAAVRALVSGLFRDHSEGEVGLAVAGDPDDVASGAERG
jgi:dihydrofolate reductase